MPESVLTLRERPKLLKTSAAPDPRAELEHEAAKTYKKASSVHVAKSQSHVKVSSQPSLLAPLNAAGPCSPRSHGKIEPKREMLRRNSCCYSSRLVTSSGARARSGPRWPSCPQRNQLERENISGLITPVSGESSFYS